MSHMSQRGGVWSKLSVTGLSVLWVLQRWGIHVCLLGELTRPRVIQTPAVCLWEDVNVLYHSDVFVSFEL